MAAPDAMAAAAASPIRLMRKIDGFFIAEFPCRWMGETGYVG
ncbi:MAG TPA: hypothetical protein VK660_05195 [Xanthomonadaceae bacterium]|nr:hypothetical protein [Xanthomonadaceae bacterium]